MHLVRQEMPNWSLAEQSDVHDEYFQQRDRKNGLRVQRTLEKRLTLMLAERWRVEGNHAAARRLIIFAVENWPGHTALSDLEANFTPEQPIDWYDELTRRSEKAD